MAKMGAPIKYNIQEMIKTVEQYTASTDLPILKELCYKQHWSYDYIMELKRKHEDLSQSIKELLCKKEAQLERMGLMNKANTKMAMFSLKQLGWRERVEIQADIETEYKENRESVFNQLENYKESNE